MRPINRTFYAVGGCIIFILVVGLLLAYINSVKLKDEILQLKSNIQTLEENFKFLQKNYDILTNENQKIKDENKLLKQESTLINSEMKNVQIELSKAEDKLNEFQITVQDSIQWFKQNINIENYEDYDLIKEELNQCIHYQNGCRIDLLCLHSINKNNGFRYKLDEETSKKVDFLQDLKQIFNNKGGDCEDISLLFRAEYNYLLNQCLRNYSRNEIIPYTRNIEINKTYMYIVCGTWDPKETVTGWAGHCMVALSKAPIISTGDVYSSIKTSTLIEPQNGQFEGHMDDTDTIHIFPDGQPPNTLHYIYFVITDDDLKIFYAYSDEVKWFGYQDFMIYIDDLKNKVKK